MKKGDSNVCQRVTLRREFRTIDFGWFCELLELAEDPYSQDLRKVLQEEEDKAVRDEVKKEAILSELSAELIGLEFHRGLAINVLPGIDLEHTQAIIAYGITDQGSRRFATSGNPVSLRSLTLNVQRKLGPRFRRDLFEGALAFLMRHRVIFARGEKRNVPYSFNQNETSATPVGRELVIAAKQFLYSKAVKMGGK